MCFLFRYFFLHKRCYILVLLWSPFGLMYILIMFKIDMYIFSHRKWMRTSQKLLTNTFGIFNPSYIKTGLNSIAMWSDLVQKTLLSHTVGHRNSMGDYGLHYKSYKSFFSYSMDARPFFLIGQPTSILNGCFNLLWHIIFATFSKYLTVFYICPIKTTTNSRVPIILCTLTVFTKKW